MLGDLLKTTVKVEKKWVGKAGDSVTVKLASWSSYQILESQ